jgi:hypothetical protein
MGVMQNFCATARTTRPYDRDMLNSDPAPTPTRTLTVVLSEAEWRALRAAEPDALGWLQSQIKSRLAANAPTPSPRPPVFAFHDDEY